MSSFFRSAADISESGEDTSQTNDDLSSYAGELSAPGSQHETNTLTTPALGPHVNHHHQNLLLHALLEERCLNDVLGELNEKSPVPFTKDDPIVKAQAAERYRAVSAELATHGVVASGFEGHDHRHVRQKARDGLSLLSRNISGSKLAQIDQDFTEQALVRSAPRMIAGSDFNVNRALTDAVGSLAITAMSPPNTGINMPLMPNHPVLDSARYTRDFDEVCMLGKGGYGTVYRCSHRLDGRAYAVKKIPLGPAILYRVRKKGQSELNAILAELKTMAHMEHPNIVRYFSGWIEWSVPQGSGLETLRKRSLLEDSKAGAELSEGTDGSAPTEPSPINTIYGSSTYDTVAEDEDGIVFGNSTSARSKSSARSVATMSGGTLSTGEPFAPTQSRNTFPSVSDEEIETISREDTSSLSFTDAERPMTTDPTLTLHIQMSLYPLTLAEYLRPPSQIPSANATSLQHCFHLPPSANILLAILNGVDYLHSQGIVHRDLKPANIFLNPQPRSSNHHTPAGTIDPTKCPDCATASNSLADDGINMGICIGDFGLVSTIQSEQDPDPTSSSPFPLNNMQSPSTAAKAVGTELYRPDTTAKSAVNPGLDIFALGIIFFELLCRFGTRMERYESLQALRREGAFPAGFGGGKNEEVHGEGEEGGDGKAEEVRELVLDMLCAHGRAKIGCVEVRERLRKIAAG